MSAPDDGIRLLASRLEAAGRPVSAEDLAGLLAGIAAAPEGFAGPSWLELIGGKLDEPTRQALIDARARLEYVPARAQRLPWLTGFTGSAGIAIVLADQAAIFVDGRYTLQVTRQVDVALFEPQPLDRISPDRWLGEKLRPGMRLGFDPWLHGIGECDRYVAACATAGAELVALDRNPIDAVWADQPPAPLGPVVPHAHAYAGETSTAKRQRIAADLAKLKADAAVFSLPDSIAWLLNIRGADVPHVPLPLSFAILRADASVDLFIDPRKLTEAA